MAIIDGKWLGAALIVFYDKKRNILLEKDQKRSKDGEEYSFFGGGIESGESPEMALVREIKEELTYDLKEFQFVTQYSIKVEGAAEGLVHLYVSPFPGFDKIKLADSAGMELVSIDEAKNLKMFDSAYPALDKVEEYLNKSN